jgi:hypothetical protein
MEFWVPLVAITDTATSQEHRHSGVRALGGGGGLLHVDMFAHNKSGIAYRDKN